MTVTLNYTSKGLIDAVQRELQKQKSEGKISGDTSFKSITSGKFWSTIKKSMITTIAITRFTTGKMFLLTTTEERS